MNPLQEHDWLEKAFRSFFLSRNYTQLLPSSVTSRIDPTVYLVNSATNLFKKYIGDDTTCAFAIQPSIRTQILQSYYSMENETAYPTCFDSYGVYVNSEDLQKLIDDSISFFCAIGLDHECMRFRACYDDPILLRAASRSMISNSIVLDDRSQKYDHKYGGSLTGRAIKLDYYQDWQQKYKNLCYFILIYEDGNLQGAEMATSDQLLLMRLHNRQYAISVARISHLLPTNTFCQRRFADAVTGAATLIAEGLRPNSSNTNGRTLKKYLAALCHFGSKLAISPTAIANDVCTYARYALSAELDAQTILSYLRRTLNE